MHFIPKQSVDCRSKLPIGLLSAIIFAPVVLMQNVLLAGTPVFIRLCSVLYLVLMIDHVRVSAEVSYSIRFIVNQVVGLQRPYKTAQHFWMENFV